MTTPTKVLTELVQFINESHRRTVLYGLAHHKTGRTELEAYHDGRMDALVMVYAKIAELVDGGERQ